MVPSDTPTPPSPAPGETALVLDREHDADFAAIRDLLTDAFGGPIEAQLVEALRQHDQFDPELSVVARQEGEVVGHLLLFPLKLEGASRRVLSLAPMGVRSDMQGKGIGSQLVREAIDRAWARDYDAILVLGDPPYYSRFGFGPAIDAGITGPYSGAGMAFQALLRDPERPCAGQAHYPPEFDGV